MAQKKLLSTGAMETASNQGTSTYYCDYLTLRLEGLWLFNYTFVKTKSSNIPQKLNPETASIVIHWFRRDLRIDDNIAFIQALSSKLPVLPVFIFDTEITDPLEVNDRRISFIYQALKQLDRELKNLGSGLMVLKGKPVEQFEKLTNEYRILGVYTNQDYDPYAIKRDESVMSLLLKKGIYFHSSKDQVVFEKEEVLKVDGKPYTVFTPYSRKWKSLLNTQLPEFSKPVRPVFLNNLIKWESPQFPALEEFGFKEQEGMFSPPVINEQVIKDYHNFRDIPFFDGTSHLSVHLRFGTISIRKLVATAVSLNEVFLNELIWREFFMQILWHYPEVVNRPFKSQYEKIGWVNNIEDFQHWCKGETGYPLVDAGMRELRKTGYMHNRVRMITASFLVKHLLVDWQWGEAWFAEKLMDFELSSNNGNWQWAAGTGCDAAPYFRIFNPISQAQKFDPDSQYIRKWVPEFGTSSYPSPIIEHIYARNRCLETYASVRA
jgi:deoxyribodipyrimidine photo-lyase